ncbi:MAG: recombination protein RecR [Deltaproteobacteria bacterium]|nr:recombination protein RecR [Deltaproteobacteria bacterium]
MDPIQTLVQELCKLPGIGEKTATRLAFHILYASTDEALALAKAIQEVKERIRPCSVCFNLSSIDPCPICADMRRDQDLICVVEDSIGLNAVERAGVFRGVYHVLSGVIAPLEGIGPDQLKVKELVERVQMKPPREVILSTNPTVEGEATSAFLSKILKPHVPKITRIARGVPSGSDLEYVDRMTLSKAFENRRDF